MRGTTPIIRYEIPFMADEIESGYITFVQNNAVVLEIVADNWVLDDSTISIHLTQAQTLLFDYKNYIEMQISIKTKTGEVYRSDIMRTHAERILKNESI